MNKRRAYAFVGDSMHPHSTEFSAFVNQMHRDGKQVTRAMAIKWIISSYKREALIRFGANRRATEAVRAECAAGGRERKREGITRRAIAFAHEGSTITEKEAEAFVDSGISVVMQRLVAARASTYVYDREARLFVPADASDKPSRSKSPNVVRAIFEALEERDCTAAEIASMKSVSVHSVRCILNRMRRAGSVEHGGKKPGRGRGKTQIVWRSKEAACDSCI